MRTLGPITLAVAALLLPTLAACGGSDADESDLTADVYDGAAPVEDIQLRGAFTTLQKRDRDGNQITDAHVDGTFAAPSLGISQPVAVTITVRGNTSVAAGECSFPKLKVKFKDSASIKNSSLKGHTTIRIATHCGELAPTERTPIGRVANEISPWREAFVYRVLRAAGIEAPRARPTTISYVDTAGPRATIKRKAAFIETTGDVADRLGAKEALVVDSEDMARDLANQNPTNLARVEAMDTAEVARVNLIEALVGNSDFRLTPTQENWYFFRDAPSPQSQFWNMKAVILPNGKMRPIPVDFDLSGVVAPSSLAVGYPGRWSPTNADTQGQFVTLAAARMRFSKRTLDAARKALAANETKVMALLKTTWHDAEARKSATTLFKTFFAAMKDNNAFYTEVITATDAEYLRADGTANEECLDAHIPVGTPVYRFGNSANGLEEVSLLDVRMGIPCNEERVWIKKGTATGTAFPK